MDQPQAKYEGWTLIELFGHGTEAGYVTTQYFGDKAMFQVDVPELEAHQETLKAPRYIEGTFCPEGTVVERAAVPGRSRFVSPGAIYAMNPAEKDTVMRALFNANRREIKVLSIPERTDLPMLPGETDSYNDDKGEDGGEGS